MMKSKIASALVALALLSAHAAAQGVLQYTIRLNGTNTPPSSLVLAPNTVMAVATSGTSLQIVNLGSGLSLSGSTVVSADPRLSGTGTLVISGSGGVALTTLSALNASNITTGTLNLGGITITGTIPVGDLPTIPGTLISGTVSVAASASTAATLTGTINGSTQLSGSVTIPVTTGTGGLFGSAAFYPVSTFGVTAGNEVFVDGSNGNDGTGAFGNVSKPFKTIDAAAVAARSYPGSMIMVGPGSFATGSNIVLNTGTTSGLSIVGAGRNQTFLSGTMAPAVVEIGNGSLIKGVTITGSGAALGIDNVLPCQNALIENSVVIGSTNAIITGTGSGDSVSYIARDTTFRGLTDLAVQLSYGTVATFWNCVADSSLGSASGEALNYRNGGSLSWYGGEIACTTSYSQLRAIYGSGGVSGSAVIIGAAFNDINTNTGNVYDINPSNSIVRAYYAGCSRIDSSGPVRVNNATYAINLTPVVASGTTGFVIGSGALSGTLGLSNTNTLTINAGPLNIGGFSGGVGGVANGIPTFPHPIFYVATTGDNATAIMGDINHPWADWQTAYTAADAYVQSGSASQVVVFGLYITGVGITTTGNWDSGVIVKGINPYVTKVGGITVAQGEDEYNSSYNITLVSDLSVDIGGINANGGSAPSNPDPSTPGGAGGDINVTEVFSSEPFYDDGGNGGNGDGDNYGLQNGGSGGNAGTMTIRNSKVSGITGNGGNGGYGYAGGYWYSAGSNGSQGNSASVTISGSQINSPPSLVGGSSGTINDICTDGEDAAFSPLSGYGYSSNGAPSSNIINTGTDNLF